MRECTSEHMSGCDDNEVKEMRKIKNNERVHRERMTKGKSRWFSLWSWFFPRRCSDFLSADARELFYGCVNVSNDADFCVVL